MGNLKNSIICANTGEIHDFNQQAIYEQRKVILNEKHARSVTVKPVCFRLNKRPTKFHYVSTLTSTKTDGGNKF